MDKIVFLDIDGPVIPGRIYDTPLCSDYRSRFAKDCIERLNLLCEKTGAQIVTNSMQNYLCPLGRDLRTDLIKWGLNSIHFHTDWRTCFPRVDYRARPNPQRGWGRWLGILDWMEHNGEVDWICFDDRNWTADPRLILVDFETGITDFDLEQALDVFAVEKQQNFYSAHVSM